MHVLDAHFINVMSQLSVPLYYQSYHILDVTFIPYMFIDFSVHKSIVSDDLYVLVSVVLRTLLVAAVFAPIPIAYVITGLKHVLPILTSSELSVIREIEND